MGSNVLLKVLLGTVPLILILTIPLSDSFPGTKNVRVVIFSNRKNVKYLAPSLYWVWVILYDSYWILNVKRVPVMYHLFSRRNKLLFWHFLILKFAWAMIRSPSSLCLVQESIFGKYRGNRFELIYQKFRPILRLHMK